jgi:Zn-dependent peptidase ImmA (M78 family)
LGFSLYDERCPVIVVKKARWEAQQAFTLMHELGHLLLHRSSSIDDQEDMEARVGDEREANAFAGNLLVPDDFLLTISDADRPTDPRHSDTWLARQRQSWGVSAEMILRRLLDAHRITRTFYNEYRSHVRGMPVQEDASGSRAWRHREPKHIFGEPFVRTVLDALASRRITATKACSYLDGLKLSDLHQLERHVAGL